MNKQIRQARAIYRKYKDAYHNHMIAKFAAEQAEINQKTAAGAAAQGTDGSGSDGEKQQ